MKYKYVSFITSLFFAIFSNAQTEITVRELDLSKDSDLIKKIELSGDIGIPFPYGSSIFENKDKSFLIKLPENYLYILKNETGQIYTSKLIASTTCDCSGGGCSPVSYKKRTFCVMENCGVCTKSSSLINTAGSLESVEVIGIFNTDESAIKFSVNEYSNDELKKSFETTDIYSESIHKELLRYNDFKKHINDFYILIYGTDIPSFIIENKNITDFKKYQYVEATIYGNLLLLPIPVEQTNANHKLYTSDGYSCKCSRGSGCVEDSFLGAHFCSAGKCSKCTLNH